MSNSLGYNSRQKHISTGAKTAGQWVSCTAAPGNCKRNHVSDETLQAAHKFIQDTSSPERSLKEITEQDVHNFKQAVLNGYDARKNAQKTFDQRLDELSSTLEKRKIEQTNPDRFKNWTSQVVTKPFVLSAEVYGTLLEECFDSGIEFKSSGISRKKTGFGIFGKEVVYLNDLRLTGPKDEVSLVIRKLKARSAGFSASI